MRTSRVLFTVMSVNQTISRQGNLPLFPDCFNRYIEESGRIRTPASRRAVRSTLWRLQQAYPGKRVMNFMPAELAAFCLAGDPAPNTQKARRSQLQSFFGWATFRGLVLTDPSRDLKFLVHPGSHTVKRHVWLAPDEFRQLLRELPTETLKDRRNRMIVYVGAMVGLRKFNLEGLCWSMFARDLSSVKVTVKRQKLQEFGVPELLQHELKLWRKELAPDQGADGPVFPAFHTSLNTGHEYETTCEFDHALGESGIFNVVKAVTLATIGVEMRPHDLRRSFASYLESEGFSIEDISRALGHENIATTSRYLDHNPHRAVSVGQRLTVRL